MTPTEYIKLAGVTDVPNYDKIEERLVNDPDLRVIHAIMGIVTEAGELMDAYKKYAIYGKPIDKVNLKEEAGDLLWYVALLIKACDTSFEEVMEKNIEKLKARYGDKFTEHAALHRELSREREILEN